MERKLTAILSADVKGYSRLMGEDEEATIRTLTAYRKVMTTRIGQHRGRVVDSPGDNLLAEFVSIVAAVRCAVEIQQELKVRNAEVPDQRKMEFRIGINLGDVVVEGERLYGDGVNIAARIEGLADPGGICLSGIAHDQVKHKLALTYEDLGAREVKNIAEAVPVWRVAMDEAAAALAEQAALRQAHYERERTPVTPSPAASFRVGLSKDDKTLRVSTVYLSRTFVTLAGLLLLAGTIVAVRSLSRPSLGTQDSASVPQAAPALSLPDKPSIVVLPFSNLSGDSGQEYFSDGITEDLTTALAKVSALFVIARNSAFTYKGKPVDVKAVSRELGVRYVLEGSVRKADGRVRITAQLVDGTTGHHLWAESYDRDLKDTFAVQDEVRQKIVMALKVKLTPEEEEWFRREPTANLEAYEHVLRGIESLYRYTKEANIQARQMFEKALELDPHYAGAYALLGWTYLFDWFFYWSRDSQNLERAFELAQRARALEDSSAEAYQLLSTVYLWQKQYEQAITEVERAIALDPNYADNYNVLAIILNHVGRPEEAIGWAEKAMRLDPRGPNVALYLFDIGLAYRLTGRVEEAIAINKQVLVHDPNFQFAYIELAVSYVLQWSWQLSPDPRALEQAFVAAQKAIALNDSLPWPHKVLGQVYLWQKQPEQARAETERAIALDPNEALSSAALAEVLSCVGRPEDAIGMVEQALRRKPFGVDWHLDSVGAAYYLAGRPEEAIASLKQYLGRYPNILHAHMTLAAAYSELGREAEARAEATEVLRINPQFSLEVHKQRVPIKDPAVLERHLAALRKAGLK
jgi:adenylate cyclase